MRRQRSHALPAVLGAALLAAAAAAEVADTSYVTADGQRVLQHETVIDAPVAEVWDAFTTHEGITSWMVPRAAIDFRLAGTLETSYRLDGELPHADNIRHEFLAFLPQRMIAMRVVHCPPGTPHPEVIERLWWVVEMSPLAGDRTRVSIAMTGFADTPADDEIFEFFDGGNTWTFEQLRKRFTQGPIDWTAAAGEAEAAVEGD